MKYLKSTVETELFLPRLPEGNDETLKLRLLVLCDAALMNASEGRSQGARLIWLAEDKDCQKEPIKVHLIFWESKKISRVCRSSLAAETYSVQDSLGVAE